MRLQSIEIITVLKLIYWRISFVAFGNKVLKELGLIMDSDFIGSERLSWVLVGEFFG